MLGETLSKYRIVEKIGQGGMGVVYKAEDLRLGRDVALKLLAPELTRDAPSRARFLQEAQAISRIEHPNICVVHEIDETEDGRMFMAMTFYAGETLRDKIARGPLQLGEALDIAIQIAQGLARAHEQQVVHRDIKPANILVPDRGLVKILDFGIAKLLGGAQLTQEGRTLGTTSYMSPEQVLGDPVDHRTDLWSLGVVLYEMLTGNLPFPGEHPQGVLYRILNAPPRLDDLRRRVPLPLAEAVRRCLEKAPERRFASAWDLVAELDRLRSRGLSDPAASPPPRSARIELDLPTLSESPLAERSSRVELAETGAVRKEVEHFGRAGHAASRASDHTEAAARHRESLRLLESRPPGRERDLAELDLLMALAPALNATQGYDSPEVAQVWSRALEVSQLLGGEKELGRVLHGLWAQLSVRGPLEKALDLGFQLVQLGERLADPEIQVQGHSALGSVLQGMGYLEESRRRFEHSLELCRRHGSSESGVQGRLGWTLWFLGHPDQARALAGEISHPWISPGLHQLLRDAPRVERETRELAVEDPPAAAAAILRGWAQAILATRREEAESALARMRQARDTSAATGARLFQPYYLLLLAEACLLHGRFEEAGEALDRAFPIMEETGERLWEAALQSLRGDLARRTEGEGEAEDWYHRALATSRRQGARSCELRAAMGLARLWADQGRRDGGRGLLEEVYGRFDEGFETADLIAARELLAELA